MGLAASQGRFLLLTSRQSDVELRMQSLTNQKLALAREASALSAQHVNALNAKNVMWNTEEGSAELQYNDIMCQNSPYFLTNAYGAVMLDNGMYSKLSKFGLSGLKGSGDDFVSQVGSKEEFLTKILGADRAKYVMGLEDAFNNPPATPNAGSVFTTRYCIEDVLGYIGDYGTFKASYDRNEKYTLMSDTDDAYYSYSWWGLKEKEYDPEKPDAEFIQGFNSNIRNLVESFTNGKNFSYDDFANKFGTALVEFLSDDGLADFKKEMTQAAAYAKEATQAKYLQDMVDLDSTDNVINDGVNDGGAKGRRTLKAPQLYNYNGADENLNQLDYVTFNTNVKNESSTLGFSGTESHTKVATVQVGAKELVNTFCSFFDKYCEEHFSNLDDDAPITQVGGDHTRVHQEKEGDVTYNFGGTSSVGNTINGQLITSALNTNSEAAYWLKLYNQLAKNGWQVNSQLSNSEYIQKQMLYGNVLLQKFVNYSDNNKISINDANSPMSVEEDKKAIEEEERRYEAEKDQLDYKETVMDTMLQDLDAEREAIQTEKESVKKIIESNIKKFKIFDA